MVVGEVGKARPRLASSTRNPEHDLEERSPQPALHPTSACHSERPDRRSRSQSKLDPSNLSRMPPGVHCLKTLALRVKEATFARADPESTQEGTTPKNTRSAWPRRNNTCCEFYPARRKEDPKSDLLYLANPVPGVRDPPTRQRPKLWCATAASTETLSGRTSRSRTPVGGPYSSYGRPGGRSCPSPGSTYRGS